MTQSNIPYDATNTTVNPWLLNVNVDESLIDENGEKLTAEYIWSKQGNDRENLVNFVFSHYRKFGFPKINLTKEEIDQEFNKLCIKNSYDVFEKESNIIKNSNSLCTDILKSFCGEKFYSSKGHHKKSKSCYNIFNDDLLLRKVLKNRMGYETSKEGGETRPYVFNITDKMLIQGMKSSGLAYNVSTFKPLVAKFITEYMISLLKDKKEHYKVFDYSSGWGARFLGAHSIKNIKVDYIGVDPYTYDNVNKIIQFFNQQNNSKIINACSEDEKQILSGVGDDNLNTFDICWSSPPYYTLETYGENEINQSISTYPDYNIWLEKYWDKTIKNIKNLILNKNSYFGLVMVDKVDKYDIANDMNKIIKDNNFELIETLSFSTSKSHLSGKAKTKSVSKNTERVYIYKNMP